MKDSSALGRLPIDSPRPLVVFAWARLALCVFSLSLVAAVGLPFSGRLAVVVIFLVLPWCLGLVALASRSPAVALNPLVAVGDILLLLAIEVMAPETYGAVRFTALAFLAVHAHFQGGRIGLALAAFAVSTLVPAALLDPPNGMSDRLLGLFEPMFAAAALATGGLVGSFRTAESASRLRARELTRRTMRSESDIRRRVAEALHDGPVQELIGLDMVLAAAQREARREGASKTVELLDGARDSASRNVVAMRDEMVDLGPHGMDELSYETACERCIPTWQRRYGLQMRLRVEYEDLPSEAEGDLFRITQEAVVNAAKHGGATLVEIDLSTSGGRVELRVRDNGSGLEGSDPFASNEPGHIGLAAMRERTELLQGTLRIDSSSEGTTLSVSAPLPPSARSSRDRSR
ncbi:MAG: sensor histidine kinase [Thermoleophilaceae bacterium]